MISSTFCQIQDGTFAQWIGFSCEIFTSLEGENPGESIKDHMVLGALLEMKKNGILTPEKTLTEASAGSTALSLAYYCRELEIPNTLFVPDFLDPQEIKKLKSLGSEVRALPLPQGWDVFHAFCQEPHVVPFNQLFDPEKTQFYCSLGDQITHSLGAVDSLVGAVGTGHSLLGISSGMTPKPKTMTAEPIGTQVPGIRNLDLENHGEKDFCRPTSFDQRILLNKSEFYPEKTLKTSEGLITYPESFQVCLGAIRKLGSSQNTKRIFALGAANRRIKT